MQVAELDLDALDPPPCTGSRAAGGVPAHGVLSLRPAPGGTEVGPGAVFLLVRHRGRPVGTLAATLPDGVDPARFLAAAARERLAGTAAVRGRWSGAAADRTAHGAGPRHHRTAPDDAALSVAAGGDEQRPRPLRASVVVATRERPGVLGRALDSLLAQDHPDFEVVVVDNAPLTGATRELVERKHDGRVRYVREPVPGLAVAHNRGVAAADAAVLAFTDDDVVADPHWLTALTAPFAEDSRIGCVTGLILPARLGTPAQVLLESHGGFAKGFVPRTYDPARPPADEPLFPFTAGRFGSGANMAFRAGALRAVGGFDPATGTGTAARGGDDLYAFVRILTDGHRLRYTPDALVWHHHRETERDLRNQAFGYGAGLTAYLTALVARRPGLLPALLARLPRGLAHARSMTAHREAHREAHRDVDRDVDREAHRDAERKAHREADQGADQGGDQGVPGQHGAGGHPWPRSLSRLERRGMLAGPLGYVRARRRVRRLPLPWEER
ncbi:glycosyl transferase family 2 [Streptomyces spongiicola]|uniref:Glycosyl transferase family 2 n=1 Tax=Streptomyces spongiicola TaxID=1690221 RepID=A0ABM6V4H9_9ACTN|nr:glycosyltransferase [Streptomyces spongiicola]AWK09021.1 glycosyl transferase family 2 [Streptomyces spongiicola]